MNYEVKPLVSIIVPTYNRAGTIERAINSILNQTYTNLDVIIIDDGSMDKTKMVLNRIHDKRIRIFTHPRNKGVCAAKNTGLDNIKGEWFFIVDSDDEILPTIIEELIQIPLKKDPEVNHVTCNVVDFSTKEYHGKGFEKDQYWDEVTIDRKTKGAFKGLIKTDILGKDRFNEKVTGFEDILWTKIRARSKGYYVHQGLYIWHTEGEDRVCKQKTSFTIKEQAHQYREIADETYYWSIIMQNSQNKFIKSNIRAIVYLTAMNDKVHARIYSAMLSKSKAKFYYKILGKIIILSYASFVYGMLKIIKTIRN